MFTKLFKTKKNVKVDITTDVESEIQNILTDLEIMQSQLKDELLHVTCNHNWIDYDKTMLNKIALE